MIILVCNLEKSKKVERVENSGNAPPGEIGYEKILITDCKCKLIQRVRQRIREDVVCRSDPTSRFPHNPSPPAGGAAFQNNSFSFIILSLRADAITDTLCRADVVFDTQSFFMGGPDVLLCQSARPTSMIARPTRSVTLPGPPVVHCY